MTTQTLSISSLNSTTVRMRNFVRGALLRAYFGLVSRLSPGLARRHSERLFTTPPRRARALPPPVPARRETIATAAGDIALWQAGPADAPAVLLIHGWGGVGTQLGAFVGPLRARGFRVVWFDQPGHGASGYRPVALPDLVRAIEAIAAACGPLDAAIGHSLGASAVALALRRGLRLSRVALISAPTSMREHLHGFARLIGIPPGIRDAVRQRIESRYAMTLDEIDRLDDLARLTLPALIVHDRDDREVPFAHAQRLADALPQARLTRTYGLGHFRIVRDADVVGAVVDFVRGRDTGRSAELPVLPHPAPLY